MPAQGDFDSFIGRVIGARYQVIRKLNQGGMGAVYLAMQMPLMRPVALKVLLKTGDPTAKRRFEKEAYSVSRLVHPHVVTLFDFGPTETGDLFIAMEYLEGHSLRELLDQSGPMPWDRTLHILRGVASALVAAHTAGIIHRDLKPENVMLVERSGDVDFAKVLDFGLARSLDGDEGASNITQRDVVPGTPAYLSPERANGIATDPRSDLYALGAVWFELLTGRPPFEGESNIKIILKHIHEPPRPPSTAAPRANIPPVIDHLVLSLLEKQPERRPATAKALLDRIDDVLRPRGWHVGGHGDVAHHARHDAELNGYAHEVSALDELAFELEQQEEAPIPLTVRKSLPPQPREPMPSQPSLPSHPSMAALQSLRPAMQRPSLDDIPTMPAPDAASLSPLHSNVAHIHLLTQRKGDDDPLPPPAPERSAAPAPPRSANTTQAPPSPLAPPRTSTVTPLPVTLPLTPQRIVDPGHATALLQNARSLPAIAEVCVGFLAARFDRSLVADVRKDGVAVLGHMGMGDMGRIHAALPQAKGLWDLAARKEAYYGAALTHADWTVWLQALGGPSPGALFVGSLKRAGAPAFLFYGDHRDLALKPSVRDVVGLMRDAATALSRLPS